MEISEILQLGIEASIALAGFAGVIATYQTSEAKTLSRGTVAAVTVITRCSLLVGLACAMTLLLQTFEVKGSALWAISSAVGAVIMASVAFSIARSMKGATQKGFSRLLYLMLQSLGGLVVITLILNAVGLVFDREPGPFVAGIVYGLSLAGIMFSRLLLMPLWRIVHEVENEELNESSPA
jgi:hypothetical protein